jgi:hypothetical protein
MLLLNAKSRKRAFQAISRKADQAGFRVTTHGSSAFLQSKTKKGG